MGLGEKDGEEFDQVKVALVPVLEPNVPNEFGLGGHVVVSDHAAVPPGAELHSDESTNEMLRGKGRGGGGVEGGGGERCGGRGYPGPFLPHGSEGPAMGWEMGERLHSLPPGRYFREENLRGDISTESPRTFLHVHRGWGQRWAKGALETAAVGPRASVGGAHRATECVRRWVRGWSAGWDRGKGSSRSEGS